MKSNAPLPPLSLALCSALLATGWLQPNHYPPWPTFHTDAWISVVLAAVSLVVLLRTAGTVAWRPLSLLFLAFACTPMLQFFAGMLPYRGHAAVNTLFGVGFVLALLVGSRWEEATPGRAADALFLAIGIASIASVGMQLRQWFNIDPEWDVLKVWMVDFAPGRPSGNLGQPNQLATLLLWGGLAGAWGMVRGYIGRRVGLLMVIYLLFGLALTQSRMGMLAMALLVAGGWWWRRLLPPRAFPQLFLLFGYFLFCTVFQRYISEVLDLAFFGRPISLGDESSMQRLDAYRIFIDAVMERPWLGYGWSRLAVAQLAVAQDHPHMTAFFLHSHNLFLDFVLWCGLPVGLLMSFALVIWMWRRVKSVRNREDVVLVCFLLVVGLHAMVELPLHHAYFLLPTGLIMGMLEARQRVKVTWRSSRWAVLALLLASSVALGIVMRDYMRVDESFRAFRFEINRVGNLPPGATPEVLLLDNMADFMRNARSGFDPSTLSEAEFQHLYRVMTSFPNVGNLLRYAEALAYLRSPEETRAWLIKIQKVTPEVAIQGVKAGWLDAGRQYPKIASVPWPEIQQPQVHEKSTP